MAYVDTYNNITIDIRRYEEKFKKIFKDIVELPKKLKEYISNKSKTNHKIQENFASYEDLIEFMYYKFVESMIDVSNELAYLIKENHLIIEEYYDYLEIHRILKRVLKNNINEINILEIELFTKILDAFKKITDIKFNIVNEKYNISEDKKFTLSDLSDKDKQYYMEEYNKFGTIFLKYKMEFYSTQQIDKSTEKTVKKLFSVVADELME